MFKFFNILFKRCIFGIYSLIDYHFHVSGIKNCVMFKYFIILLTLFIFSISILIGCLLHVSGLNNRVMFQYIVIIIIILFCIHIHFFILFWLQLCLLIPIVIISTALRIYASAIYSRIILNNLDPLCIIIFFFVLI